MKITKLLLGAVALLGLTSCLNDDSEQIETTTLHQVFNCVEDTQNGNTEIVTGVSYTMEFNFTKGIVNLAINGLQVSQSTPSYTIAMRDIKYTLNDKGEIVINVPSATNGVVTVTDFKLKFRQRTMNYTVPIPVYDITYTVNSTYKVRAVQQSTFYFGKTTTTILGTESVFDTDKIYYCVTFDPTVRKEGRPQARFFMYDAQFAPKMPQMNLMLLELYADINVNGYSIDAPTAKVYTGTVQNPKEEPDYAVTDFNLEGMFSTGINFDYIAAGRFHSVGECGYNFTEGMLN